MRTRARGSIYLGLDFVCIRSHSPVSEPCNRSRTSSAPSRSRCREFSESIERPVSHAWGDAIGADFGEISKGLQPAVAPPRAYSERNSAFWGFPVAVQGPRASANNEWIGRSPRGEALRPPVTSVKGQAPRKRARTEDRERIVASPSMRCHACGPLLPPPRYEACSVADARSVARFSARGGDEYRAEAIGQYPGSAEIPLRIVNPWSSCTIGHS